MTGRSYANALAGRRFAGPMPWIIAAMTFLTALAALGSLASARATRGLASEMAGQVTVEIAGAPDAQARARASVLEALRTAPGVRDVRVVPEAELRALLAPWLGEGDLLRTLPLPVVIDARLASGDPADLQRRLERVAPGVRVTGAASGLGDVRLLLTTLQGLGLLVALMTAAAMIAAVVLTVRSATTAQGSAIAVMHQLGATDGQIAALVQRRAGVDAAMGAAVGTLLAIVAGSVVAGRLAATRAAIFTQPGSATLDYLTVLLVPLAVVGLTVVTARVTMLRMLGERM